MCFCSSFVNVSNSGYISLQISSQAASLAGRFLCNLFRLSHNKGRNCTWNMTVSVSILIFNGCDCLSIVTVLCMIHVTRKITLAIEKNAQADATRADCAPAANPRSAFYTHAPRNCNNLNVLVKCGRIKSACALNSNNKGIGPCCGLSR